MSGFKPRSLKVRLLPPPSMPLCTDPLTDDFVQREVWETLKKHPLVLHSWTRGQAAVGIIAIRSSCQRACPSLLSCFNRGTPDQSQILGAQSFSPDGTHLLTTRRVPTPPQGEKGFLEDGAGGLASSGSLNPSTHLRRPCRGPGERKRFSLLTPASRLSENHSWLSVSPSSC